ncbi:HAMP domain-containing histidine kinase [Salinirubellus salinus]|uniref:histidine kinase n=1 Tax=Salinirubellus salinus TaxID=1364945 RepID=A0A9E7UC21_9EURY|nr:HAMP domain-containing sensor histidine kinase [Salinirubellus salinus]UWM55848.1 HAMP domain-containing histidine kinase [Salinirubellus salinus]
MNGVRTLGNGRWTDLLRARGLYALALVLVVGGVAATPHHFRNEPPVIVLFYAFVDVCLPLGVMAATAYVSQSDFERPELRTVTAWATATVVACWALYAWSRSADLVAGEFTGTLLADMFLYGNLGAVLGLIAGANRARAAQNARLLHRTAAQQDALEFINHLLRHNVLNGLQVVEGYGDLLEDHVDDEGERYLTAVQDRTDHMAELVGNVRVLMRTLADGVDRVPVDVSATLHHEVSVAAAGHPEATFESDLPTGLTVLADSTLGAVFENLLTNAVVHSDRDHPRVDVSAVREGDDVVVRIADDGPGIPESLREVYLREGEQSATSTGDGLGLYLASTLVTAYGGVFTIDTNDPRGAIAELRLPHVEASDAVVGM